MLDLFTGSGVGPTILFLSFACFVGFWLGKVKVAKVSLGITWVLFVGIILSACGVNLNHDMLNVIKEFGLILFVTAVGIQVGPNFFASFKKGGLLLNILATCNVALAVLVVVLISKSTGESLVNMAGVYTGAITNTPGMSAAQQTVSELGIGTPDTIANGYAVAYPLGVVGLILSCLILKRMCRVDLAKEPTTDDKNTVQNEPVETSDHKPRKIDILTPIFIMIFLGVILGSVPIPLGMSAPVKLGLAGGPLVMAILVSWFGVKKGLFRLRFTTSKRITIIREMGISLFLAAVGLSSGGSFVSTIQAGGYIWILYGVIITMVPTLIIGLVARLVFHVNFYTLMGMIGGGTTDPPTLAFANTLAVEYVDEGDENQLPNMGYATVYPLTMFLRILTAQLLVLFAV